MADELTELRTEVAALRAELKQAQEDLQRVRHALGLWVPRGEEWPRYPLLEVEALIVRNPANERSMPLRLQADETGGYLQWDDGNFRTRCEIRVEEGKGAVLNFYNAEGKVILSQGEIRAGDAYLYVAKSDGQPAAGIQVKDGRGIVNVLDEKQRVLAALLEMEAGGEVLVGNRNGKPAVVLKATELGGVATVHEPSGQMMGFLMGDNAQGMLSVCGPHGAMAASMGASALGGAMVLFDMEGNLQEPQP